MAATSPTRAGEATLERVLLSWPTDSPWTALADPAPDAPESWIQVAKTGSFVSQRYGKFSITPDDLTQMLTNFTTITPKPPTMIPVDYDHLSMDPQRPGDGVAAGWLKKLVLRANGNELWGLVAWTPDAATAIKKKQYQFVSPSFVKDYVYKNGEVIGTTLLAAAITNHPFLEGMAALTLSGGLSEAGLAALTLRLSGGVHEMALRLNDDVAPMNAAAPKPGAPNPGAADPGATPAPGGSMDVGQKVSIKDDEVQKPEQLGVVFTIAQVVGQGDDQFVSLQAPDGTIAEWFRADELQPAAANANTTSPLPEKEGASFSEPASPGKAASPPSVPIHPHPADNTTSKDGVQAGSASTPGSDLPTKQNETLHKGEPASPGSSAKETDQEHPVPSTYNPGTNLSREKHMKTFELRDTKGNTVTIGEDAIAAIAERAVPAGSVVIAKTEYEGLKSSVTNLSGQINIMADAAAKAEKRARLMEMSSELDRLSKAAKLAKPERDWAAEKFKNADQTDLTDFRVWAKMVDSRPALVSLGEHGSGLATNQSEAQEASDTLQQEAERIAKEKRLPYRDALILASRLHHDSSSQYLEQFRVN
jgi:Mu-like prophage I protein